MLVFRTQGPLQPGGHRPGVLLGEKAGGDHNRLAAGRNNDQHIPASDQSGLVVQHNSGDAGTSYLPDTGILQINRPLIPVSLLNGAIVTYARRPAQISRQAYQRNGYQQHKRQQQQNRQQIRPPVSELEIHQRPDGNQNHAAGDQQQFPIMTQQSLGLGHQQTEFDVFLPAQVHRQYNL